MTRNRILLIEDTPSDMAIMKRLLQNDSTLELIEAVNGEDALAKIDDHEVDLLITDLRMPRMNGIELMQSLRSRGHQTPVIVVTSKDSSADVVEALSQGASHFVRKKDLATTLHRTVRNVTEIGAQLNGFDSLQGYVSDHALRLELENDNTLITPVIGFLQEKIVNPVITDESDRMRIGISLEESLANALYHGNLEISSELREKDDGNEYYRLAEVRKSCEPFCHRRIYVSAKRLPEEIHVTIRDEGKGFDPTTLPDPTDPANMERVHGRGLLLIRTFMNEVHFNEAGNEITMIKRAGEENEDCDE